MQQQTSHNRQKKLAVINDFCGFGRCSIAVALPIISAMHIQCCPLPTAIFSDHTGFESFFCEDFTEHMPAYSREWDYKRMREIADKVGALLMVDMAHTAGLIAAGLLDNPVKYAHIVTSTTHKTLRGPRGGVILMGKDFENPWGVKTPKGEIKKMSAMLNSAVFPGIQGGPLEHVIAAKAVDSSYKEYQAQVQKNAKAMAAAFVKRGYKIVSGGTDNHLMLIDLRTKFPDLTGKQVEKVLVKADITTNKNMVPFDSRSPFQTSGIRVGTPAITTRGLKEDQMETIVELIDRVLSDIDNESNIVAVRKEVNTLMAKYPLFAW